MALMRSTKKPLLMAESRLRIGIIGEAEKLRHWQGQCMQALLEVPGIELVFLAETADAQHEEKTSILYRRWSGRRSPAKALERAGSPGLLNGLPRIPFGGGPSSAELEKLRGFHPDVLLQLSSAELPESFHNLPRLGTWRFIHGERLPGADEIPGLRETLNGDPVVSVSLQRSPNGQGSGSVLRSGCFGAGGRSVDEIAETVLQCCAEWPAQVCWALISGDPEAAIGTEADPLTPSAPSPSNVEMLQLWWKQLVGGKRSTRASGPEEWNFGVLPQPIASLLEDRPSLNVRWLPPPGNGRWRSTPFGIFTDGKLSTLYEKHDHEQGRSVIGRLRPKRDNNLKRSRDLLTGGGRLSYPFIVEHEGAVYVVPENGSGGQVVLYSLNEDQTALTPVRTLLDEALCSPTLFRHDGRWWLFGTKAPLENTSLYAYHAEHVEGPYTPHALNPIKTDIRSARPGGTPFRRGEELWRPAQDHSVAGTVRIALNRVTQLSPSGFAEETVRYFEPLKAPWSKGIRTLSAVGDITLVDGMRHSNGKSDRKKGPKRTAKKSRESEHDDLNEL